MNKAYDKYYQTENLFGEPYPELLQFFSKQSKKLKILDLGCGQGRNAVALARIGFDVTGIDNSAVGIEQMNQIAEHESFSLNGAVADIYAFDAYQQFDIVLLDSMFHFAKNDRVKEIDLITKICNEINPQAQVVICIQKTGDKVKTIYQIAESTNRVSITEACSFDYQFTDDESGQTSTTPYQMIVLGKG